MLIKSIDEITIFYQLKLVFFLIAILLNYYHPQEIILEKSLVESVISIGELKIKMLLNWMSKTLLLANR